MKKLFIVFSTLISFMITGCGENPGQREIKGPVKIDLDRTTDKKAIDAFQSRLSVELLPLETTDSSFFSNMYQNSAVVRGDVIVIADGYQQAVLRFNRRGGFIAKSKKLGNGPQEYRHIDNIFVSDKYITVCDRNRIQQYDYDFNYMKTIPFPSFQGFNVLQISDSTYAVYASYMADYQLYIINNKGEVLSSFFPKEEKFANTSLTRGNMRALSMYGNELYVSNYFDPAVYFIEADKITDILKFDFGKYNIPDEFFTGDPRELRSRYMAYRNKMVGNIDFVHIWDHWAVFSASPDPENINVIYLDRSNNEYINSKDFSFPYSGLLKASLPLGITREKELFFLVPALQIKKLISELAEKDTEYRLNYSFLQNIDPSKITENGNDWMMFVKIKE